MPVHRQTQSYLRNLFARRGIAPQHRFGQNFLIDLNIHELIANAADVGPDDVVLEVGPGAGALTALMASRGAAVVAVEIDPGMARLTAEATAGMPNVRIVVGDALANKHTMHPEVLDNLRAGLAVDPGRRLKLVANLPYNVATPDREQPARAPRALPEPDGRDHPARAGRADARRARDGRLRVALGDRPGPGRLLDRAGPAPERLLAAPQGRLGRRSPSPPTPPGGPPSATWPGSTRSSARSSCTAARTSGASCTASGATAGPRRRSTRCSKASA